MNAVDTQEVADMATTRSPVRRLAELWAVGTGLAVLLTAAVFLPADAASGPLVVADVGEVTLGNVVGLTFFGATVGAVLAEVVRRFARKPRLTFLAVTLIALAGYAVVPFTAAETTQTAIWLNVFHVVVAIPVIGILTRYLPRNRTSTQA